MQLPRAAYFYASGSVFINTRRELWFSQQGFPASIAVRLKFIGQIM